MIAGIFTRRIIAAMLIGAGLIGLTLGVYTMVTRPAMETLKVEVPLTAITQSGISMLSAILMTGGAYLAGYRRGSRTNSRITLDFSKKKMEA